MRTIRIKNNTFVINKIYGWETWKHAASGRYYLDIAVPCRIVSIPFNSNNSRNKEVMKLTNAIQESENENNKDI